MKTATGVTVAAIVTDSIGNVASFIDPTVPGDLRHYVQVALIDPSGVYLLQTMEHCAVGDLIVTAENGLVRKCRFLSEKVVGVAVAMEETRGKQD